MFTFVLSFSFRVLSVLHGIHGAYVVAGQALGASVSPGRYAVYKTDVMYRACPDAKPAGCACVCGVVRLRVYLEPVEQRADDICLEE